MEYVIHLTEKCNLNCKYCYEKNNKNSKIQDISFDNIKALIDYVTNQKEKYNIIYFYGGEPLLRKDIIKETINYINSKKSKTKFYYSITTNGTLLDDAFINYMKQNKFIYIAYSIDGLKETQDLNRITFDNKGSFDIVEKNAKKVLNTFDSVIAMVAVTKNNLHYLSKNIEYLINLGFNHINLQFNYLDNWQDDDLKEIKKQYSKIASIYADKIMQECDLEIPIIDDKIKTYVNDKYNCNDNCQFGMKTINVGTDGNFYPCMQFVNYDEFIIGNCKDGIDKQARLNLIKNSKKEQNICKKCAIRKRCKHTCECINFITTSDVNDLSPIICETEKIFIEVADKMAEQLHSQDSKMFIQKYYNKNYDTIKQFISKYENKKQQY